MSRFKSFMDNDLSYTWLDLSEVVCIRGPFSSYPEKTWYSKGRECYLIRYILKSGMSGGVTCWNEDLANNYITIMRRDG